MSNVNKSALIAAAALYKREPVTIPGIDNVFAREVSPLESQQHFRSLADAKTPADEVEITAKLVIRVLVDNEGSAILSNDDLPTVQQWPARVLNTVAEASRKAGSLDPKNG